MTAREMIAAVRRRWSPKTVRQLQIAAAMVVIVLVLWRPLLIGVARFMTVETPIERADAIVPLYQDPVTIPAAAATWFQRGYAPHIVIYRVKPRRLEKLGLRPPAHETMRRLLEARGVPPQSILEVGHDIDNASELVEALLKFLGPQGRSRVLVVASAPRSRLAWGELRDAVGGRPIDLRFDAVPPAEFDEHTWWTTREGVISYFDSYTLWLLRSIR